MPGTSKQADLAGVAYRYILDRILRGALPMGAEIPRRKIAAHLGMSLLPVGEALQRLELEMLVESGRRVGTRVRIPTPQEIRGFCTVREALETQAARLFQQRATASQRTQLRRLATRLDALYEKNAAATRTQLYELRLLHQSFHLAVADGAACPYLRAQIEVSLHLVFHSFYDRLFGARRLPKHWHVQLAQALCEGTIEEADRAARHHLEHHVDEILYRLEPYLQLDRDRILAKAK